MSAPALAPSTRPARPAPGRPASGRPAAPVKGRSGPPRTARTAGARTSGPRTTTARATSARTAAATARSTPRPTPRADPRPRMRVVQRPDVGPRRIGFAVTCTALLAGLMLGLLLLNVAISGNAFTLAELQSQRGLLVDQQQSLEQQLLVESSPGALAAKARALGMVPAAQVLVIAPDGTGASPVVEEPVEEP